jgi:hypothetical protein
MERPTNTEKLVKGVNVTSALPASNPSSCKLSVDASRVRE